MPDDSTLKLAIQSGLPAAIVIIGFAMLAIVGLMVFVVRWLKQISDQVFEENKRRDEIDKQNIDQRKQHDQIIANNTNAITQISTIFNRDQSATVHAVEAGNVLTEKLVSETQGTNKQLDVMGKALGTFAATMNDVTTAINASAKHVTETITSHLDTATDKSHNDLAQRVDAVPDKVWLNQSAKDLSASVTQLDVRLEEIGKAASAYRQDERRLVDLITELTKEVQALRDALKTTASADPDATRQIPGLFTQTSTVTP